MPVVTQIEIKKNVKKYSYYVCHLSPTPTVTSVCQKCWSLGTSLLISRSEQAPGSEFHTRDKSEQVDSDFLGLSWCTKKVNPEI